MTRRCRAAFARYDLMLFLTRDWCPRRAGGTFEPHSNPSLSNLILRVIYGKSVLFEPFFSFSDLPKKFVNIHLIRFTRVIVDTEYPFRGDECLSGVAWHGESFVPLRSFERGGLREAPRSGAEEPAALADFADSHRRSIQSLSGIHFVDAECPTRRGNVSHWR